MKRAFILVAAVLLGIGSPAFAAGDLIKVDGSSTVFPITEAVAEEFGNETGGRVIVGISGTGGGFKKLCRGEIDISDASRPIKDKEIKSCKEGGIGYIEIPVAYDGLAVVINPENTWVDQLTVEDLSKIWKPEAQAVVTNWSQVRAGFPDVPLRLFGPGTDSGTFDYFTEAVNGQSGSSRGDYTASEDDNVLVEGVARDKGGLGYFGLAYYEQNSDRLKVVPIVNGKGEAVRPSLETVKNSTYEPLSRPIYIYVNTQSANKKESVRKFVEFYLKNAAPLVTEVGYIPLPDNMYQDGLQRFQSR